MPEVVNGASGADQKPRGSDGNATDDTTQNASTETVAYETHRKLLAEKKRRDEELRARDEELAALKREKKEAEELKLKEKEDYKKIVEIRDGELAAERAEKEMLKNKFQDAVKFDAFINSLPGSVDKKFWQMIDLSAVVIDPTTNEPDPMSVKKAADKFRAEFPELIVNQNGAKLPNNAASGGAFVMNDETWNALSAKEKKDKLSDYMAWKKTMIGKK